MRPIPAYTNSACHPSAPRLPGARPMRLAIACLACCVLAAPAVAAEPIKVKLEDFKFELPAGSPAELFGHNEGDSKLFFYAPGAAVATFKVPADGEYTLTLSASCDEGDGAKAKMRVQVGDKDAKAAKVDAKKKPDADKKPHAAADEKPEDDKKPTADSKKAAKTFALDKEITLTDTAEKEYTLTVKLKAGEQKIVLEFTNDAYKENEFDRNLYVHAVKLEPAKKKAAGKAKPEKETGK